MLFRRPVADATKPQNRTVAIHSRGCRPSYGTPLKYRKRQNRTNSEYRLRYAEPRTASGKPPHNGTPLPAKATAFARGCPPLTLLPNATTAGFPSFLGCTLPCRRGTGEPRSQMRLAFTHSTFCAKRVLLIKKISWVFWKLHYPTASPIAFVRRLICWKVWSSNRKRCGYRQRNRLRNIRR